jgi:low affinity Fe/Cu permease
MSDKKVNNCVTLTCPQGSLINFSENENLSINIVIPITCFFCNVCFITLILWKIITKIEKRLNALPEIGSKSH